MSNIDFYFSIGSTYTYLTITRILDVEKKHSVKFNWKPFSVRAIMKEGQNNVHTRTSCNMEGQGHLAKR